MNASNKFDYIIVGQGLAGSLLSYFLHQKGTRLLLIDQPLPDISTRVAAGIINPVTGRRYVKSWRIDELLPFAQKTFSELETLLGVPLFQLRPILRALFTPTELNHWNSRLGDPGYESYLLPEADPGPWTNLIHPVYAFGEIAKGGQANLSLLLDNIRPWLSARHAMLEEAFRHEDLIIEENGLRYRDFSADRIIFCEGHKTRQNPWFSWLPYEGAKGEVLRIRIHGAPPGKMLRHHFFLVPMEDGTFWAGSNYWKKYEHGGPSEEGREWLIKQLERILSAPYEIVSHQAAIRPTVPDHRPYLGAHPERPNLFIFNGLGTKGASQGPFFASHMADFLAGETALDPEVDIRRFYAKSR